MTNEELLVSFLWKSNRSSWDGPIGSSESWIALIDLTIKNGGVDWSKTVNVEKLSGTVGLEEVNLLGAIVLRMWSDINSGLDTAETWGNKLKEWGVSKEEMQKVGSTSFWSGSRSTGTKFHKWLEEDGNEGTKSNQSRWKIIKDFGLLNDEYGKAAMLRWATINDNLEIIKNILNEGVSPNISFSMWTPYASKDKTPIYINLKSTEAMDIFIEHGWEDWLPEKDKDLHNHDPYIMMLSRNINDSAYKPKLNELVVKWSKLRAKSTTAGGIISDEWLNIVRAIEDESNISLLALKTFIGSSNIKNLKDANGRNALELLLHGASTSKIIKSMEISEDLMDLRKQINSKGYVTYRDMFSMLFTEKKNSQKVIFGGIDKKEIRLECKKFVKSVLSESMPKISEFTRRDLSSGLKRLGVTNGLALVYEDKKEDGEDVKIQWSKLLEDTIAKGGAIFGFFEKHSFYQLANSKTKYSENGIDILTLLIDIQSLARPTDDKIVAKVDEILNNGLGKVLLSTLDYILEEKQKNGVVHWYTGVSENLSLLKSNVENLVLRQNVLGSQNIVKTGSKKSI
jgi:hypothetical protein